MSNCIDIRNQGSHCRKNKFMASSSVVFNLHWKYWYEHTIYTVPTFTHLQSLKVMTSSSTDKHTQDPDLGF